MTTVKPFANNTLEVYAYEKFDYTISNPDLSYNLQLASNTSGLNPTSLYFTKNGDSNYRFSVQDLSNNLTPGTREAFVLTINDASGNVFQSSSNTVNVNPGRFLDVSGIPLLGNNYTFYKNETITPIRLVAPSFTLATPTSVPTLPPGLSYSNVASNIFDIVGAPLTTVPTSNYQIIGRGSGSSKIVTTRFNITVSNERVRLDLSGSPIISNMQIGTDISTVVITARPPVTGGTIRYTFPSFPDGIVTKDKSGNSVTSPVIIESTTDASYTLVISGAPTSNAAIAFRNAGIDASGSLFPVTATRINPLPLLSNTTPLTFAFGPTVLFDTPVLNPIYTGVPVVPSEHRFRAKTYFASDVSMSTIFSPDLRSDLSLIFFPDGPSSGYADLSTVSYTAPGSATYTIRAINASNVSNDYPVTIAVINDTVSFTKVPTDLCFNFVLSRPVNLTLPGYYSSNIQYQAEAGSKFPVVLSAPALAGTGLSLDASTGTIVGIPTSVKTTTPLVVTAIANVTDASASVTRTFAILDESFNFVDVCTNNFNFVQNTAITPFQIPVTTLSGRNVIDYTLTGNPAGITINPAGVVSGTCLGDTSGNMTVTTTTGFANTSRVYPYSVIPDNILFTVPKDVWVYTAGDAANVQVTGVAFSGTSVSNFAITLPPSFGLSIGSSNGLIFGNWSTGVPPEQTYPASSSFNVTATAGSISGTLPATITVDQLIKPVSFVWGSNTFFREVDSSWTAVDSSNLTNKQGAFDIQFRNSNVDGNIVLITARNKFYRADNYTSFTEVPLESTLQLCSTLTFDPITTAWWASGTNDYNNIRIANIMQSDDNGRSWYSLNTLVNEKSQYIRARDNNSFVETNPYLSAGVALKFKDGILMAGGISIGGPSTLRSTDGGFSWSDVCGSFEQEVAYFNFDNSATWIATGSSLYQTRNTPTYSGDTDTIKYSTDQGVNWSNAVGAFNMMGYEVVYGSNTWLASGVSYDGANYNIGLKYSTDGVRWSNVDLSTNYLFSDISGSFTQAPLPLGSIRYDGSNWSIFVQRYDSNNTNYVSEIYTHNNTDLSSGWTATDVTSQFNSVSNDSNRRFVAFTRPQFLRSSIARDITVTLTFTTKIGLGPALTSPSQTTFLQYQYVPIAPIQLEADDAYFFIDAAELPPGLSFNPLTRQITGKPIQPGSFSTRVYAKNNNGVTLTVLSFTVNIPRIVRKQDGAGAYTSLLKQYTEVLAAQSARDNKALPTQETRLGEFMSPVPAKVTTQTFNTNCAKCGRGECPAANAIVSSEGAETNICDFIDANGTDLFDAGNANTNLLCDN